ncbi:MAG TPA: UdgX family uracil-DNA binding protein [Casimicrobiaceae bacterium]|nr:UdgX family uracil-DNA binding protein [Casimicrobiaceae bacterium]
MKAFTPYERWRREARKLLASNTPPEQATWEVAPDLFDSDESTQDQQPVPSRVRVPASVVDLVERVACHRDPRRSGLMYRLLWRVTHGEHDLLQDAADDDVIALTRMARAVDRASHKMTAFVRFRELRTGEGLRYVAWFEPEHDVLARTAPFFARRFGTMVWTIATPDGGSHWDRKELTFFDVDRSIDIPADDAAESLWVAYYASIFNPARLNIALMRKEMPATYWKNLPETRQIASLVTDASPRVQQMIDDPLAREVAPYRGMRCESHLRSDAPEADDVPTKHALDDCRRCPLGVKATQGVPGDGPMNASLMLVGEQPGDEEDLTGKPFVGPAGRLLRKALIEAGIDVASVYVTNAVKHFSFEPRGKRRIHKTPAQREIEACRSWLGAEIARVKPLVIVALGASALHGTLGERFRVGEARELELIHAGGARVLASYHPSAVLRAQDEAAKSKLYAALVEDLRSAAALLSDATA